jgi:putative sterol carrier protein
MASGELSPTTAFMMGKLKVDGSMSIAMKLADVL